MVTLGMTDDVFLYPSTWARGGTGHPLALVGAVMAKRHIPMQGEEA